MLTDLCIIKVIKCIYRSNDFYYPKIPTPVKHCRAFCSIPCPLSWFDGPRGSGHPDPHFRTCSENPPRDSPRGATKSPSPFLTGGTARGGVLPWCRTRYDGTDLGAPY